MNGLDIALAAIGFLVLMWFALGFLWVTFGMEILMPPAPWHPPLSAKFQMMFVASFTMPWLFITVGALPKKMAMIPEPDSIPPETREAFLNWRKAQCDCPSCRAERGEQ